MIGETLKLKIEKGKLKIEEAINYAIQIAQGLQKAHERGIIQTSLAPYGYSTASHRRKSRQA